MIGYSDISNFMQFGRTDESVRYWGDQSLDSNLMDYTSPKYLDFLNSNSDNVTTSSTGVTLADLGQLFSTISMNSSTPLWSEYLVKLRKYESLFNLASKDFYSAYTHNDIETLSRLPKNVTSDWLDTYFMYE